MKSIIAGIINTKKPMHYANGDLMGYHTTITFSEEELKIMEEFIKNGPVA